MTRAIQTRTINHENFRSFGDLIDCSGAPDKMINQGLCGRFHDRARLDFSDGQAGFNLFKAELRRLPLALEMVERHPLGSQAFIPMSENGFLVIVAEDENGIPGEPRAFETAPGQAINFYRGTWHGVLTPLSGSGQFAVIDRIGAGENLEEFWFDEPYQIIAE